MTWRDAWRLLACGGALVALYAFVLAGKLWPAIVWAAVVAAYLLTYRKRTP